MLLDLNSCILLPTVCSLLSFCICHQVSFSLQRCAKQLSNRVLLSHPVSTIFFVSNQNSAFCHSCHHFLSLVYSATKSSESETDEKNIFCKDKCPGSESQISIFNLKLSSLSLVHFLTYISEIMNLVLIRGRKQLSW